ncbi:MAG: hypothetical protein IKS60_08815 [Lachnospiraceae bacterium]|nr:hypothetical protein [Lachnospiraceae bacterium]MBR5917114.1 hypothetical protein [Lachnospiraceae bacterium]
MDILDSLNYAFSYDDLVIWAFFVLYGIFWLFIVLGFIIHHFFMAVPLYIMADKAGYAYPFLAFIPFANCYLMHILPIKEYNFIALFKTYERKNGFLFYMVIKWIAPFAIWTVGSILSIVPILSFIVAIVLQLVNLVLLTSGYIAKAIMMIDLLDLYMKKDEKALAIFLGIVSLFVPIVFPITCIVLCTKEPEFGYGNYYYPVNLQTIE